MILTLKIFSKNRFIFVLKILNHAAILYKIIDLCYAADLIKFVFNINKWLDLVNVFSSKKKNHVKIDQTWPVELADLKAI